MQFAILSLANEVSKCPKDGLTRSLQISWGLVRRLKKRLFSYLAVNQPSAYQAEVALHYGNVRYGSRSFPAMDYLDR